MNSTLACINRGRPLLNQSSLTKFIWLVFLIICTASSAFAAVVCPSNKNSTAVASPTTVIADGFATSTITVTIKRGGATISGVTVTLTAGSGSSTITTVIGTTNASGQATFTVKDAVVELVTYTATTGAYTGCAAVVVRTKPTVNFVRAAPTVSKSFSPTTIAANATSTLTITLTNPNTASIAGVTFTDTYPANLLNSGTPAVSNTCGGTATASAGGNTLSLSGATIPASNSCTVTVTVTSATAGSYVNSTGAVTSTNAAAGTAASATLTVTAISAANSTVTASPTTVLANGIATSTITVTLRDGANLAVAGKTVTLTQSGLSSTISAASGLSDINGVVTFTVKEAVAATVGTTVFTAASGGVTVTQTAAVTYVLVPILKNFSTSPIAANGTSTLTVTLTNTTASSISGAGFTDTYPAGLVNAANPSAVGCGAGVLSGTSGGNTLGMSGATIAANSTCIVSVLVTSATAGTYTNTATNTALATSTASLIVTAISPTLSTVSASPTSVAANGISTSTITVTLKDGAGNPVSGKTVSLSAATGSSVITAVSNAAGVATFTVTDTVAEGPITYTAVDTTDSITITQTASVTFTRITAPTVAKSFSPSTIADSGTSTLTITLTNPNTGAINGVAFSDTYPVDIINTSPLVLSNTCGGSNPGTVASGTTLTLSGGTIPASGSCAVSVQITASTLSSSLTNTTGAVTSSNATNGTSASATLTVVNVSATLSTVVASPTSVPADNTTTSTITVTLKDGGGFPVAATNVSLTASGGSSTITVVSGTTDVNGVATFTVKDSVVETVTYTATDTSDTPNIVIAQTATVSFGVAVSSFNAVEPAASATAGKIFTKIAGQNFALDIVALNATPAISTGFIGAVTVEVVDNTSGSGVCANMTVIATFTNQTFTAGDAGRHSLSSPNAVANVWPNAKIRIKYPTTSPTVTACSGDNFAIRPNSLVVIQSDGVSFGVTDSNWQTAGTTRTLNNLAAGGGNVHKAGQPLSISVAAYNAAGTPAITSNYAGSPDASSAVACIGTACTAAFGTVTLGAWAANPGPGANGKVKTDTANYSEVGAFNLTLQDRNFASVDTSDGTTADCSGYYVCSAAISVGRFVPDHFDVTVLITPKFKTFNTTNTACSAGGRSFTYIGQPFSYLTAPQATITAVNAAGNTTTNYSGTLWKIGGTSSFSKDCTTSPNICLFTSSWTGGGNVSSLTESYAYVLTPPSTPNWDSGSAATAAATVTAGTGISIGTGTLVISSSNTLAFLRNTTTPQVVFTASISDTISVTDTSEVGSPVIAGNGAITTTTPLVFNGTGSGINFDGGGASNGKEFRYGRLKLSNAHGSELLNLPIPIQAQFWDATVSAFVTNSADNCTSLAPANITLGTYQYNGGVTWTTSISFTGPFSAGLGNLKLTKPSPTPTSKGSVDVTVGLAAENKTYLQGAWTGATYTQNPSAQATFGVYKGSNEFIFLRENY